MKNQSEVNVEHRPCWLRRVVDFYVEGFRSMTVGRWLWLMIIVKVIILFAVFRLFFFPDILATRYDTDEDRADAVRSALIDENRRADRTDHNE